MPAPRTNDRLQEPRKAPTAAAVAPQSDDMELDDDELLDMMGDMQPDVQLLPASVPPPVTDTLAGTGVTLWLEPKPFL